MNHGLFFAPATLIVTLISCATFAETQVSRGSQYGPCAFACEDIPDDPDVPKYFGEAKLGSYTSRNLNVLVWNLYKGKMIKFSSSFKELSQNKDLVLVSEATSASPVTDAFATLSDFGWNFSTSFNMNDNVGTGTAIGSPVMAKNVKHFRTLDLEPGSNTPKAITSAEFPIEGLNQNLLVLSIHGINWAGDAAIVRQVEAVIPTIEAHQGPILFAGDFNFKNKKRLKSIEALLAPYGLTRLPWEDPSLKAAQLDDGFSRGMTIHRAYFNNNYMNIGSDHPAIELEIELPLTQTQSNILQKL